MSVYTIAYSVEVKTGASWVTIANRDVIEVSGSLETTGNRENAFAFGDNSEARCDLRLSNGALSSVPDLMPIRVRFSRDTVQKLQFVGLVREHSRNYASGERQLQCIGLAELVRTTKAFSPLYYRRPVATQTGVVSVEDPSSPAYYGGMINWLLWTAGGRPADQDFLYPSATFYYQCEQAILPPEWSWVAGDNAWDEALKLAQASGGQLYQRADGIIKYRQPLSFADGTAIYTFTPSVYADIDERTPQGELANQIACPYLPRAVRPIQEVVNDTTVRLVTPGGSDVRTFEPQWPVYQFDFDSTGVLKAESIVATFFDGRVVKPTDYSQSVSTSAQQLRLTINNVTATPFVINKIVVRGYPVSAGVAGTATAGSGSVQRKIADNPAIQSLTHAIRLAALTYEFYSTSRPIRTLSGCPYDPARYVGETVNLTAPDWGINGEPHVIVALKHGDTGATTEYDIVSVAGLPRTSQYYLCGDTNYTGQTKKLGF